MNDDALRKLDDYFVLLLSGMTDAEALYVLRLGMLDAQSIHVDVSAN